jgi:O-antigen/teichoic acid export membrane protein
MKAAPVPVPVSPPASGAADGPMSDNRGSTLSVAARGSALGLAGMVVGRAMALAFQIAACRVFGAKYFGLYVTGLTTGMILQILCACALDRSGMRFMAIAREKRQFGAMVQTFKTAVIVPLLLSGPIVLLGWVLAPIVVHRLGREEELITMMRVFIAAVPFMAFLGIGTNLSRAFRTAKYAVAVGDIGFPLLQIIGLGLLTVLHAGWIALPLSFLIAAVVCGTTIVLLMWRQIERERDAATGGDVPPTRPVWRDIMRYSAPLLPTALIFMVNSSMDIIMLNVLANSYAVGTYAAAARWVMLFSAVTFPLELMFGPLIAAQFGIGDSDHMRALYRTLTRWAFFLSLPIFVFVQISRHAMMGLFGHEFAGAGPEVLGILTLGTLVSGLFCGSGVTLVVSGNQRWELSSVSLGVAASLVLNLIMIPRYGVVGAAVATLSSSLLMSGYRILVVRWRLHMHPFDRHFIVPLLVAVVLCLGDLVILKRLLVRSDLLQLVCGVVGALLVGGAILFSGLSPEDGMLIRKFLQRTPLARFAAGLERF